MEKLKDFLKKILSRQCPTCNGKGGIEFQSNVSGMQHYIGCASCHGEGRVWFWAYWK